MEQGETLAERMCIVTREVKDEAATDPLRAQARRRCRSRPQAASLPGRGVWVTLEPRHCLPRPRAQEACFPGVWLPRHNASESCRNSSGGFSARLRFRYLSLATQGRARRCAGFMKVGRTTAAAAGPAAVSMRTEAAPTAAGSFVEWRARDVETVSLFTCRRIGFGLWPVKCDTCCRGKRGACRKTPRCGAADRDL